MQDTPLLSSRKINQMSQCRHDSYWLCDKTTCPISFGNTEQVVTIITPAQTSLQCLERQ